MGKNGRKQAKERYSYKQKAKEFEETYKKARASW